MALLYPWATKEYLLWEMTIGQILMYHNVGIEIKYPDPHGPKSGGLLDKSASELRQIRDEARAMAEQEAMARKYGAIDDKR